MFNWVSKVVNYVLDFLYSLMLSLVTMILDLFYFLMSSILAFVVKALDAVGALFPNPDFARLFNFPDSALNVFTLLGVQYCMGLVIASLTLRMILQLIPFTRLGS